MPATMPLAPARAVRSAMAERRARERERESLAAVVVGGCAACWKAVRRARREAPPRRRWVRDWGELGGRGWCGLAIQIQSCPGRQSVVAGGRRARKVGMDSVSWRAEGRCS